MVVWTLLGGRRPHSALEWLPHFACCLSLDGFWANSAIGLVGVHASRGGFREDLR
jgi:hypothetical protein